MIQLANTPMPHVALMESSVLGLFRSKGSSHLMYRPTSPTQLAPETSHMTDGMMSSNHGNITPTDWDELFHAVQTRLENCVDDALNHAPELSPGKWHAATKTAVLECVDAMRQLHASLTLERQEYQKFHKS